MSSWPRGCFLEWLIRAWDVPLEREYNIILSASVLSELVLTEQGMVNTIVVVKYDLNSS